MMSESGFSRRWVTFVTSSVLTIALMSCDLAQSAPPAKSAGAALMERLIATVNTKDHDQILAFARAEGDGATPAEQRAERMTAFAERGAPFKLLEIKTASDSEVSGMLQDKEEMRLAFTLRLAGAPGALKLSMLQIRPADEAGGPAPKDYSGWTDPDALAKAVMSDSMSPAIGLAIRRDDSFVAISEGVREIGKPDQVQPDEPWSVGSIGKSLCSSVIAKLIEAGKLRFEMTLKEAFPGVPMKAGYEAVTLEQVLHHRGGIPEDPGMRKAQVDAIVGGETDPIKIRDRYARDILSRDPIGKPGERFAYSNAGYALLAHLAEIWGGKRYEQLLTELVFTPLGLKHSYAGTDSLPKLHPLGHVPSPSGVHPETFGGPIESMFAGAGGGVWMSIGDLARFGEAHLQGLRGHDGFLRAATIARLHQGEPEGPGSDDRYASGWGLHRAPGVEPWHGHNGSNGTFRAELAIFPNAGLVVAAVVNVGGEQEPSPPLQAVLAVARRFAAQK